MIGYPTSSAIARAACGARGDAALRLADAEGIEELLETVAVLGKIDGVRRGAEDRHVGLFQRLRELERGLAAELDDDARKRAVALFGRNDFEHVLLGQRLEIEPVRRVVVGRHRLGIAVDHDGLVARFAQRKAGVTAAIVELDALADAVRTAAENDHLAARAGRSLVRRDAGKRRLVGRIHVGRGRGEFGGAGIDPLEHRTDAELVTMGRHLRRGEPRQSCKARVGKAHGLEPAQGRGRRRQPLRFDLRFGIDDAADLVEEPRIDLAGVVDLPRSTCRAASPGPPPGAGQASARRAPRGWRSCRRPRPVP